MAPRPRRRWALSLTLLGATSCSAGDLLADGDNDTLRRHERPETAETGGASTEGGHEAFLRFMEVYDKKYEAGTQEYHERKTLYEQRRAEIDRHNSRPGRLWTAAVNRFADHTPEELARFRGYRRTARAEEARPTQVQFLAKASRVRSTRDLPRDFNWQHLAAMRDVQDQSECGSCWAFASSAAVRAHSEIWGRERKCSVQQIVSCTPNPMQCGGEGGCKGATAELAMEYIMKNGCITDSEWLYTGKDGACPSPTVREHEGVIAQFQENAQGASGFGMVGYTKLPENRVEPVLLALYEQGPVAVSLAAGYSWNAYASGIMDACPQDAVIDHAVTLVGFGEERRKYWVIQNSWGPAWGENGFIRLLRHGDEEENAHCGWDKKPEIGSGCKGGPSKVWVCGSCGILYDTVVPNFQPTPLGLMARRGRWPAGNATAALSPQKSPVSLHD